MPIAALTKPVDELTSEDILDLISNRVQESESVEFKEGLSSSGIASQATSQIRLTNDDKAKILKEIVAFANGYCGRLFIGIAERPENPPVAASIRPIADCANLADRLGRVCGDLIDPPMLRLDVAGIVTEQDGSGLVVFDVPSSIRAPHMSKRDYRSYRRRGAESVPMDMREIQDMALRIGSRHSQIEAEFAKRKNAFNANAEDFCAITHQGYCFRLSFVPLNDLDLGHVHRNPEIIPENVPLNATLTGRTDEQINVDLPWRNFEDRPIVRGTQRSVLALGPNKRRTSHKLELWSDGGLEVWFARVDRLGSGDSTELYPSWLVAAIGNGLRNVERVRKFAAAPSLSYGCESQLSVSKTSLSLASLRNQDFF